MYDTELALKLFVVFTEEPQSLSPTQDKRREERREEKKSGSGDQPSTVLTASLFTMESSRIFCALKERKM